MDPANVTLFVAGAFALYMAWNIGANDVANAMGTSVGSGALDFRHAVILAGIFEFAGALLAGGSVTNTIRKGLIDVAVFEGAPLVLAVGMTCALLAAAAWLHIATFAGWPVSTTHSIVGAVVGFGVVAGGADVIEWAAVGKVSASWIVSPLCGGLLAYLVMRALERTILGSSSPSVRLRTLGPPIVSVMLFVLTLTILFKGLKPLHLDLGLRASLLGAAAAGLVGGVVAIPWLRRLTAHAASDTVEHVERVFGYFQIMTACFVAFAHGSNDVANAVGPLAAVRAVARDGLGTQVDVPILVLLTGAVGIVIGLATYGYRVIATVGERITELTPLSGFSAEFGAATTIVVASKLGMPVSTTHTLVGAVIGVGLARRDRGLDWAVLRGIGASWVLTVPLTGVLAALLYAITRAAMSGMI